MKYFVYIILLVIGIFLFRFGHGILNQINNDKPKYISEKEFWNQNIVSLQFTPEFFFRTIDERDIYPEDGILYFKLINSEFRSNRAIINSEVIQNNKTIYKNSYLFDITRAPQITKIIINEVFSGETNEITDDSKINSIMKTYKGFIDLWLIYNGEK